MKSLLTVRDSITRPNDTTQYTAGDVIAEATNNDYLTFNDCTLGPEHLGNIRGAKLFTSVAAGTKPTIDLLLFNAAPAETADNNACAITDAELLTLVAVIPFAQANVKSIGPNQACVVGDLCYPFKAKDTNGVLYGVLVERGTYTPAAQEVFTVELSIEPVL